MRKALFVAVAAIVLAVAAPCFAQGPFADVPIDHWAYEAVSQLQDHGIVIGYPDGTFSGKRAMTRYEFALALSRAIPVIKDMVGTAPAGAAGVSKDDVQKMIDASKVAPAVSSADIDALKKSLNEFKDELSGMGVDLDALKRDVASLEERVAALEEASKRLKITTKMTFFAMGDTMDMDKAQVYDKDGRPLAQDNNLLKDVSVVRDADVIFSYENGETKGKVVLNAGNYLNGFLGGKLTSFDTNPRTVGGVSSDNTDDVSLFMAYAEVPFVGADWTFGRFPIQFTKWTLKKIDVDSYTENWKTDDGNYYVDGGKAAWTWGSVDLTAFAGKNNGNSDKYNYVARPFDDNAAFGNLQDPVQSAGLRAQFPVGSTKWGLTVISAGEGNTATTLYDNAYVWGADVAFPVGSWKWTAAYTQSNTSAAEGSAAKKVDAKNDAWEVATNGALFGLDFDLGYKSIAPNFSAPGDWGKIGYWQNPTNIKGPEVGLKWAASKRLSVKAFGGFYDGVKDEKIALNGAVAAPSMGKDDKVKQYKGTLAYQTSSKSSMELEGEWVRWDPSASDGTPAENYYTLSYNRMIADNSKLRLLYQIVDYDPDNAAGAGSKYNGSVAVAQVSMDF